jgi:hypothetical protein
MEPQKLSGWKIGKMCFRHPKGIIMRKESKSFFIQVIMIPITPLLHYSIPIAPIIIGVGTPTLHPECFRGSNTPISQ